MRSTLKIEAIGDDTYQYMRFWSGVAKLAAPDQSNLLDPPKAPYWVALIIGFDSRFRYQRQFLKPKKDYAKSNSKGSRGVFLWYILESGYVYEVSAPVSWKRIHRYFCTVTDKGEIINIDKEVVDQWIRDHSASILTRPQDNG